MLQMPDKRHFDLLSSLCNTVSHAENCCSLENLVKSLDALAHRFNISLIVLFGSCAGEKVSPDSDIDIGVLLAEGSSENSLHIEAGISRELWMMLRPRLELDLVILNRASSLMKRNVAKTGVPLYAISPEQWRAFRLRAFREFEDDEKFRNRRWEQVKRRILNGSGA